MTDRTIQAFELLLETAQELLASEFVKFISQQGMEVTSGINPNTGVFEVDAIQPDQYLLSNFLFPLRVFLQKRRSEKTDICSLISLKRIAEDKTSSVSDTWRKQFEGIYLINTLYLDEYLTVPNFTMYTHRYVIDVFLYGGKFHIDQDKKAVLDEWKKMEFFYPLLYADYMLSLFNLSKLIYIISIFTKKELERLKKKV